MCAKIVYVDDRLFVRLDSNISPVTLRRFPESKGQKEYTFWEMFFSETTLTNPKSMSSDIK